MDITAKKMPADEKGMRIAELDEKSYRYEMWEHEPIKDFWRVGSGYTRKLHSLGLRTMGDIARFSLTKYGEDDIFYSIIEGLASYDFTEIFSQAPSIEIILSESLSFSSLEKRPYANSIILIKPLIEIIVFSSETEINCKINSSLFGAEIRLNKFKIMCSAYAPVLIENKVFLIVRLS